MKRCLSIIFAFTLITIGARAQQWSVGTNAVDWVNFGTVNVDFSMAVSRHFTVGLEAKYNPWTYAKGTDRQIQNRQRAFYATGRWYPWFSFDGWHVDAIAGWREYNAGGFKWYKDGAAEEGDAFGGGFGAGYTLLVHKNFNLEFGAMMWMGAKKYVIYDCPNCGKIRESGTKFFIMPTNITIGATWVFGTNKYKQRSKDRSNLVEK